MLKRVSGCWLVYVDVGSLGKERGAPKDALSYLNYPTSTSTDQLPHTPVHA